MSIDLTDTVQKSEPIARFICSSSWYSKENSRVKSPAFMPHPDSLDLSVFRIQGLDNDEALKIGEEHVARPGRTLHGFAKIHASTIYGQELNLRPDDIPPRHADVTGWPTSKSEQKLIAQQIAATAQLNLTP